MQIFIYNMDRQNDGLVKSLEDLLIKKQELLSFGSIKSEVIAKNNGYLILDVSDQDSSVIWTAIKMIAKGCSASYWVTDYSDKFKFITLKKANHEFNNKKFVKKVHEKPIEVTEEVLKDLKESITTPPPSPKKEIKKIEKIKLDNLTPVDDFSLKVKYNPDKPFSLAQVGREKKLIRIPVDSWLSINGKEFNTNDEGLKSTLIGKGFGYNEAIPSVE